MSELLTGRKIKDTYLQLVRIVNNIFYDGAGNVLTNFGTGISSIGINVPSWLTADGPLTANGDINISAADGQLQNLFLATPDGTTGEIDLRSITVDDIPELPWSIIGSGLPTTLAGYGITDAVNVNLLGVANGVATLDGSGKLTSSQIPSSIIGGLTYKGTWDANINSPTLTSGIGTNGWYYKVSVAGNTSIDGNDQWNIGDLIIFDGTTWDKIDGISNEVLSVFGRTGIITAQANDYSFDQLSGIPTTLAGYGITDSIVLTSDSYSDPSWITSLAWSKITGAPTFTTTLSTLTDVNLSTLTDGQLLKYDFVSSKWINFTSNALTSVSINTLNGFFGSSSGGINPSITMGTTINGILKGNGTSISSAIASDFPTLNQNTTGTAAGWTVGRLIAGNLVDGTSNVAFSNKFIVQGVSDSGLSSAQFLGSLPTGILKNTTTTGILSIASASDITGQPLTGYVSNSGTISNSDSILSAIEKLNGNINAIVSGVSSVFGRTGDVVAQDGDYNTSQVTENINLYFTNTRAIAATLAGYISGAGTIGSADSILSAIQKLDGNISSLVTGVSSVNMANGAVTLTVANTGTSLAYDSIIQTQLNIPTATTTITGLLSNTDWTTFNNKQSAGNYITALVGEVIANGPGSVTATISNAAVISKVLTGYVSGSGTISSGDSILSAIQKLNGNIALLTGAVIYQGTWDASINSPTLTSGMGIKGYLYKVSVAGNTSIDGNDQWNVGDTIIFDGTTWDKIDGISNEVLSVNGLVGVIPLTGTTNRITISSSNIFDISASYVGQTSITTLGTISTGIWQGTNVALTYGGTNADLSSTGGTGQYLKQITSGAAVTVGTIAQSDYTIGTATPMTNGYLKGVSGLGTFVTAIPNTDLANSSITINGTMVSLGGSMSVTDAILSFSDITTNNSSISQHGFLKKLSGTATQYMDGSGNWSIPIGTTYTNSAPITLVGNIFGLDLSYNYNWTGTHNFTTTSTITSTTSATLDDIVISAATTTITGTTHITTTKGFNKFSIYKPTITNSSSITVDVAATLYIEAAPLAAASVTITNPWAINVGSGNVQFPGTGNILGTIIGSSTWNGNPISLTSYATGTLQAAQFPALNGDITTTAGSLMTTLATVNSNVGTFSNVTITVNAKGLITAASNGTAPVTNVTGTSPIVSSGGTTPAISFQNIPATSVPANTTGGSATPSSALAYSSNPTSNTLVIWDANKNLFSNNMIDGYSTTPTASGTTTLTVSSTGLQYFTGTQVQNCQLPVTSTLVIGQQYVVTNQSTGNITIQSSGGNTIQVMLSNTTAVVTCIGTTHTTAADWQVQYIDSTTLVGTSLNSTIVSSSLTSVGTITSGTWHGTAIDLANYVSGNLSVTHLNSGTGASSSTFWRGDGTWAVPPGGSSYTANNGVSLSGTNFSLDYTYAGTFTNAVWNGTKISEAYGGTNQSTYAKGDILYASAANTLSKLAIGVSGYILGASASGIPVWLSAPSGGSASGTQGAVQYDNGGSLAGATQSFIASDGNFLLKSQTSFPTAVSSGYGKLYTNNQTGFDELHLIPSIGVDTILQSSLGQKVYGRIGVGAATIIGEGNWSGGVTINGGTLLTVAKTYDSTNAALNFNVLKLTSSNGSNANAEFYCNVAGREPIIGNNTYCGGWKTVIMWVHPTYNSAQRIFVGYTGQGSPAGQSTTTDPSSWLNSIGVGKDVSDSTFQIMFNNGSGTATKVNTSVTPNTTDAYRVTIFVPSNSTTSYVTFEQITKSAINITNSSNSAKIPTAGTLMFLHVMSGSASTGASVTIGLIQGFEEQY